MKTLLIPAYYVFFKDTVSEFRTRYAFNALLLFVVTTISITLFAFGGDTVSSHVLAGIFWIIVFFSAMSGLSRTFVSEEERGTSVTLQLLTNATSVYLGKLVFNIVLIFFLTCIIAVLYQILVKDFVVQSYGIFWLTLFLGSIGLASASTILAAIIAKANTKGTLYPVVSFPILLPLLLTLINATRLAMEGAFFKEAVTDMQVLISYPIVLITVSLLFFEIVWKE